ncbi:MAG: Wzt carbohydrate-binding domain-containing protein, partial [Candidatus Omnitrophica bacterium]|nr:Wzt carbohydrate-binding domain-containing protein [Candidatus Omnitrophota bacterium]
AFQKKCFEKLAEFRRAGKTMVLTTQNLDLIERLADEAIVLERGEITERGDPRHCVDVYKKILNENRALHVYSDKAVWHETKWWADEEEQWQTREGTKEAEISSVEFINNWGGDVTRVGCGASLELRIGLNVKETIQCPHLGIALFRDDRVYCYGPNTEFDDIKIDALRPGAVTFSLTYKRLDLMPGRYFFSIAVWDKKETVAYDYIKGTYSIDVIGSNPNRQLIHIDSQFDKEWLKRKPDTKACALFDLKTINDLWGHVSAADNRRIRSVRCLNWLDEERTDFFTGEKMKLEIDHDAERSHVLWVGLFRSDKIFCFSRIKPLKKEAGKTVLTFPALPLLPGEYRISVGVWDTKISSLVECNHGIYRFAMHCRREDHGTIYLEHTWDLRM